MGMRKRNKNNIFYLLISQKHNIIQWLVSVILLIPNIAESLANPTIKGQDTDSRKFVLNEKTEKNTHRQERFCTFWS